MRVVLDAPGINSTAISKSTPIVLAFGDASVPKEGFLSLYSESSTRLRLSLRGLTQKNGKQTSQWNTISMIVHASSETLDATCGLQPFDTTARARYNVVRQWHAWSCRKMSLTQCRISRLTTSRATRRGAPYASPQLSRRDTAIAEQFRPSHPLWCNRCATPPSSAGVQAGMWWKSGRDWRRAEEPHYLERREATDEFRDVGVSIPPVLVLLPRRIRTQFSPIFFPFFRRSFRNFFFLPSRHLDDSDGRAFRRRGVFASLIFAFLPKQSVNNSDSSRESFDSRLAILMSWDRESDWVIGSGVVDRWPGGTAESSPATIEITRRTSVQFCRIFVIAVDPRRHVAVSTACGLTVNPVKD